MSKEYGNKGDTRRLGSAPIKAVKVFSLKELGSKHLPGRGTSTMFAFGSADGVEEGLLPGVSSSRQQDSTKRRPQSALHRALHGISSYVDLGRHRPTSAFRSQGKYYKASGSPKRDTGPVGTGTRRDEVEDERSVYRSPRRELRNRASRARSSYGRRIEEFSPESEVALRARQEEIRRAREEREAQKELERQKSRAEIEEQARLSRQRSEELLRQTMQTTSSGSTDSEPGSDDGLEAVRAAERRKKRRKKLTPVKRAFAAPDATVVEGRGDDLVVDDGVSVPTTSSGHGAFMLRSRTKFARDIEAAKLAAARMKEQEEYLARKEKERQAELLAQQEEIRKLKEDLAESLRQRDLDHAEGLAQRKALEVEMRREAAEELARVEAEKQARVDSAKRKAARESRRAVKLARFDLLAQLAGKVASPGSQGGTPRSLVDTPGSTASFGSTLSLGSAFGVDSALDEAGDEEARRKFQEQAEIARANLKKLELARRRALRYRKAKRLLTSQKERNAELQRELAELEAKTLEKAAEAARNLNHSPITTPKREAIGALFSAEGDGEVVYPPVIASLRSVLSPALRAKREAVIEANTRGAESMQAVYLKQMQAQAEEEKAARKKAMETLAKEAKRRMAALKSEIAELRLAQASDRQELEARQAEIAKIKADAAEDKKGTITAFTRMKAAELEAAKRKVAEEIAQEMAEKEKQIRLLEVRLEEEAEANRTAQIANLERIRELEEELTQPVATPSPTRREVARLRASNSAGKRRNKALVGALEDADLGLTMLQEALTPNRVDIAEAFRSKLERRDSRVRSPLARALEQLEGRLSSEARKREQADRLAKREQELRLAKDQENADLAKRFHETELALEKAARDSRLVGKDRERLDAELQEARLASERFRLEATELTKRAAASREEYEQGLLALGNQNKLSIERLQGEHRAELERVAREAAETTAANLGKKHEAEMLALKNKHKAEIQELRTQSSSSGRESRRALEDLRKEHQRAVEGLKATHAETMQTEVRKGAEEAVRNAEQRHAKVIASLKDRHDALVKRLNLSHQEELEGLRANIREAETRADHAESAVQRISEHIEEAVQRAALESPLSASLSPAAKAARLGSAARRRKEKVMELEARIEELREAEAISRTEIRKHTDAMSALEAQAIEAGRRVEIVREESDRKILLINRKCQALTDEIMRLESSRDDFSRDQAARAEEAERDNHRLRLEKERLEARVQEYAKRPDKLREISALEKRIRDLQTELESSATRAVQEATKRHRKELAKEQRKLQTAREQYAAQIRELEAERDAAALEAVNQQRAAERAARDASKYKRQSEYAKEEALLARRRGSASRPSSKRAAKLDESVLKEIEKERALMAEEKEAFRLRLAEQTARLAEAKENLSRLEKAIDSASEEALERARAECEEEENEVDHVRKLYRDASSQALELEAEKKSLLEQLEEAQSHRDRLLAEKADQLAAKKSVFDKYQSIFDEEEEEDIDIASKVPGSEHEKIESFFSLIVKIKAQHAKHHALGRRGASLTSAITSEFISASAWEKEVTTDLCVAGGEDFFSYLNSAELEEVISRSASRSM